MNDKLQESLATLIEKSVQGIDAGVAFLSAELPDVVHQLLMWKLAEAGFFSLVCVAAILLFAWCVTNLVKTIKSDGEHYELIQSLAYEDPERKKALAKKESCETMGLIFMVACALSGLAAVKGFICLLGYASTILQILIAPKIYLIEYAAKLAS